MKAMGGEVAWYLSWSHDLPQPICRNSAGERLPFRKQKQGARSIPLVHCTKKMPAKAIVNKHSLSGTGPSWSPWFICAWTLGPIKSVQEAEVPKKWAAQNIWWSGRPKPKDCQITSINSSHPHVGRSTLTVLDAMNVPLQVETVYKQILAPLSHVESSNAW